MLLEPFSATYLANYLLTVSIHPTWLIGYHTVRLNYPPFVYAWISYYEKVRRGELVGQVLYPTHFLAARRASNLNDVVCAFLKRLEDQVLYGSCILDLPDGSKTP